MNRPILFAFGAAALISIDAAAATPFTSLHPEEAYPDSTEQPSPGPYTDFYKNIQQKLSALGFDAGPVNGYFWSKTQTALAQFQLSRNVPVSGMPDEQTLAELSIEKP